MGQVDLSGLLTLIGRAPSIARVRSSLRGESRLTIGASDAAKAVFIAALASEWNAPVLVIAPRADAAERLADELAAWLGEPARVIAFPERDPLPFERLAPSPETVRERLQATAALARGNARIIVGSGIAVAQRTLSPRQTREGARKVRVGDRLDIESFVRDLAALGYGVEPLVQEAGQASRRGGIIDVYPPASEHPVRIEMLGREVESLRLFDPVTQRSVRTVDEAHAGAAREMIAPDVSPLDNLDFAACPPEVRERFQEEISHLREGQAFRDREFYVPFLAPATIIGHLPPEALVIIDEEAEVGEGIEAAEREAEASRAELEEGGQIPRGLPDPLERWPRLRESLEGLPLVLRLSRWATGEEQRDAIRLPFSAVSAYGGRLRKLVSDVAVDVGTGRRLVIVSQQAHRLSELFADEGVAAAVAEQARSDPGGLTLVHGSLAEGWRMAEAGVDVTLLTDTEVFGFVKKRRPGPRKAINREAFLAEVAEGGYVVHIDHGIARFAGLVRMTIDGREREYLDLRYSEGDKLYVPTDQLDRVSKYAGPSGRSPRLTRLASGDWQRAKQRVRKAVQQLARDLLALYATREVVPGFAYSRDSAWQAEVEASFPYVETPDQLAAITAVKRDMEAPRPMDRLVCGDVGYGKTEVAIRAAFKAVMEGRQVAVLVPTTVLAQQHYRTFQERLAAFPIAVDVLSRFRSDAEQRQIVEALADGAIDIVIGTHRLIQRDIAFKDLGLLVIDEEQRFGVGHKEHLKKMRRDVDVLTLSATPIPRTLYMALGGIRDMSTMETPPEERLPIKTYVSEFDDRVVHEAIVREMERGGQVYFVHNRVHSIGLIASKLQEIVPEARIGIGHGQMDEHELAQAMEDFVEGRTDVLVCTTIIESGLDIPNVNTIIMNQADKLGMAQMYQLRGRVGRGARRAYAYLLYDRKARLTETARQRLATIFEATELGAGFQIALRDLEIRGAGNLLGAEQSGFMAAVGFDLYVKLLSGAVERLRAMMRGETPPPEREAPEITIDIPLSAHLPPSYVPDLNQRLALYQRLSAAADLEDVSRTAQEIVDRFGPPPALARNLLYVVALRALSRQAGVQSISRENGSAVVRMTEGQTTPGQRLESVAPRGVHVGRTTVRVELGEGWRDRLRRTLECLASLRVADGEPAAHEGIPSG